MVGYQWINLIEQLNNRFPSFGYSIYKSPHVWIHSAWEFDNFWGDVIQAQWPLSNRLILRLNETKKKLFDLHEITNHVHAHYVHKDIYQPNVLNTFPNLSRWYIPVFFLSLSLLLSLFICRLDTRRTHATNAQTLIVTQQISSVFFFFSIQQTFFFLFQLFMWYRQLKIWNCYVAPRI